MDNVYIFGHHNPDTDSVCGAIALSYLKNKLGMNAEPRILDDINKETAYVLKHFKVSVPKYLDNVKLQLKDIDYHKDFFVKEDRPIREVYEFLIDNGITGLPVVDEKQKFVGLITMTMILNKLFDDTRHIETSYQNIIDVLDGSEILRFNDKIKGELIVGGYRSVVFVNEAHLSKNDVLVTSNRPIIVNYAINEGVKTIIIVGNQDLDEDTLNNAKKHEVNIIKTPYDTFYTIKMISLANYAKLFCDSNKIILFNENEYYNDFLDVSKKAKHDNYPIIDDKGRCLGLLRLTDLDNVNRKKVILVDHNESSQSATGLGQAEILEIIDHHKIGDLTTNNPINFRNMKVGSANTIIYQLYKERNIEIPKDIAGVMLAGILSDTLILKSPTSTFYDREAVNSLSSIAEVDYEKFGFNMFKAGTSLKGKTKREIVTTDIKTFNYSDDFKYAVSQIFTLDYETIKDDMDAYIKLIEEIKEENDYRFVVVAITDIIKNGSYFIYTDSAYEILKSGYELEELEQGIYLDNQVSRKIQVVPAIINGIERTK